MITDTFYIGAYWQNRKETLDDVAIKTTKSLKQLSLIDEQFSQLYELGDSRKQAIKNKIDFTFDNIKIVYQRNIKNRDLDQQCFSKTGFRFAGWTGHAEDEAGSISIRAGSYSERITNCCLVNIPSEGAARIRLLKLNKVKEIIRLFVEIWEPEEIVLNSLVLSNFFQTDNTIGWVVYKKKLNNKIKLNEEIIHEDNFAGGHLFYLKTKDNTAVDYDLMAQLQFLIEV